MKEGMDSGVVHKIQGKLKDSEHLGNMIYMSPNFSLQAGPGLFPQISILIVQKERGFLFCSVLFCFVL